jgi:hypothetical protein
MEDGKLLKKIARALNVKEEDVPKALRKLKQEASK